MKFSALIFLLITSTAIAAELPKTHMLILGGSGDPSGDSTIFDPALKDLSKYYQAKKQKGELGEVTMAFDGGHQDTEKIKRTEFDGINKIENFTKDTYEVEILNYQRMMENNYVIKKGEQLIVYINSHGGEQKNTSHTISVGETALNDFDTTPASQSVSVDQIADLQKAARDNGIKLAIIDLSCHSGNTQFLADQKSCIISATGKNHYAYTGDGFNGTFSKNLKPGESLESVFLKTRFETKAADFPMISSAEGRLVEDELYALITPYLQYKGYSLIPNKIVPEKLTPEILKAALDANYSCQKNNSFDQLNELLDQIKQNTTIVKKTYIFKTKQTITDFSELKASLLKYKTVQDNLTKRLKQMDVEKLNNVEVIEPTYKQTWAELLRVDWNNSVKETEKKLAKPNLSTGEKLNYEHNKKVYQAAQLAKEKVIKENPDIFDYKHVVEDFDSGEVQTKMLAERIAVQEKKLYDGLYKKHIIENSQTNPCREFKL